MPPDPRVTVGPAVTAIESVRADARLLHAGVRAARVAVLSDRSVSVGVGVIGRPGYFDRAAAEGLHEVHRDTGGTAILHGIGDLAWSLVLPRGDPRVGRDFVRAYARLGAGVVAWLRTYGVDAFWGAPPSLFEDYCLLSARGQVLRVGDRILGGAAQHATGSALLHHGIVPYFFDRALWSRVFQPPDPELYERLCGVSDLGIRIPPDAAARELAREISAALAEG